MINDKRGTSSEFVAMYNSIDSSLVWRDNRIVNLISTFGGKEAMRIIRYNRNSRKKIKISCPYIIKEYYRHKGGIELLDSEIARHMTLANAWLL